MPAREQNAANHAASASKVLNERITDRKQIKLMIRDWRADHMRA